MWAHDITTILLGREIAIATVPGEPLHKLQRVWKKQADVPHPLFYGYTFSAGGTWAGYIPDLRSAAYGGYGADASTRIATSRFSTTCSGCGGTSREGHENEGAVEVWRGDETPDGVHARDPTQRAGGEPLSIPLSPVRSPRIRGRDGRIRAETGRRVR
jgi:hypothetical protein